MQITWNEKHSAILSDFFEQLNFSGIKWFVLRGYEGLPDHNSAKDVDIMVEIGKEKKAAALLISCFKNHGLSYLYSVVFGHAHCYHAANPSTKLSIHIDLIEGYVSKGFEVITFDEMYQNTVPYKNMMVLDELMNGIMLLVYKIFGYHQAKLKKSYQDEIYSAYVNHKSEFLSFLVQLLGQSMGEKVCSFIEQKKFDVIVNQEREFTKKLKKYTWKKRPIQTAIYSIEFLCQKIDRIIIRYKKYAKVFAVLAPDGTGKTTFLENLIDQLNFYYVRTSEDHGFHVYHFRPSVLPNLGEIGEKSGVMIQDTDFCNPHRGKPANPFSSLIRIAYYTLDYIIGWQKCVRNDVHYDRYTIFDRYSYDFIVDPLRTKLNLPKWIRKFFVVMTPQPKIVFILQASPETVFSRKQELTFEEITRQMAAYKKLADSNKRFYIIDAETTPEEMANNAVKILLGCYTKCL